jgi:SAM-dependent methyltransferase
MESIRKYHNAVKRTIIEASTKPGYSVLDVGCGFGGDLGKWERVGVTQLDACDPSEDALSEATSRAPTFKKLKIKFFHGDISSCPKKKYDIICYNFSLHYIFRDKSLFYSSIKEIKDRLKPGGKLIGCIPDSESILMDTPFKDEFGNSFMRNPQSTGYGDFGEKLFVHLVDTPFYAQGPKPEPICYKDILVSSLASLGIQRELWEPLRGEHALSRLYSSFIFVRVS